MTQARMVAILAAGVLLIAGAAIAQQSPATEGSTSAAMQPVQLVGVTIHAESGQSLGTIDRVVTGASGTVSQVVVSVAGSPAGHKLIAVPYGQLRFAASPGPVDVVAGFGVLGTAAPGITGPFGTAHLASTDAAAAVQPEGGPPGTRIVLPGATTDSLLAMPEFK